MNQARTNRPSAMIADNIDPILNKIATITGMIRETIHMIAVIRKRKK